MLVTRSHLREVRFCLSYIKLVLASCLLPSTRYIHLTCLDYLDGMSCLLTGYNEFRSQSLLVQTRPQRKDVLCECTICRSQKRVSQGQRQRHLRRDREVAAEEQLARIGQGSSSSVRSIGHPENSRKFYSFHMHSMFLLILHDTVDYAHEPFSHAHPDNRTIRAHSSVTYDDQPTATSHAPDYDVYKGHTYTMLGQGLSVSVTMASADAPGSDCVPAIPNLPAEGDISDLEASTRPSFPTGDVPEQIADDDWEAAEEPTLDDGHGEQLEDEPVVGGRQALDDEPLDDDRMDGSSMRLGDAPIINRPHATSVPAHKIAENTLDPFFREPEKQDTCSRTLRSPVKGPLHRGLLLLYMLVAWLHLQFHLPFRACNVVLGVIPLIIRAFGATVGPSLSTLTSVLDSMELEPQVRILPVCPSCLEVFPDSDSTPSICPLCNTFIFKESPRPSTQKCPSRTPLLRFPMMSIESQLVTMLLVPGVEKACDDWRKTKRTPGKYDDNFDGRICRELPDVDGQPFFKNDPQDVGNGPEGELRIGLTLGVDWFVYPFD